MKMGVSVSRKFEEEEVLAKDLKPRAVSVMTFGSGLPGISPRDKCF